MLLVTALRHPVHTRFLVPLRRHLLGLRPKLDAPDVVANLSAFHFPIMSRGSAPGKGREIGAGLSRRSVQVAPPAGARGALVEIDPIEVRPWWRLESSHSPRVPSPRGLPPPRSAQLAAITEPPAS